MWKSSRRLKKFVFSHSKELFDGKAQLMFAYNLAQSRGQTGSPERKREGGTR